MSRKLPELSLAILRATGDTSWHNRWEVFAKIAHLIPDGRAIRLIENERGRNWVARQKAAGNEEATIDQAPKNLKESREDKVLAGRRFVFQTKIMYLYKSGYIV